MIFNLSKKFVAFFLTILCLSIPVINSVHADSFSHPPIHQKDFQEPEGTHLIINLTGIDSAGNDLVYPNFLEIPLQVGQQLTKRQLIQFTQTMIDHTEPNRYKVIDFAEDTQITFSLTNHKLSYPISETGFQVPDLTKLSNNPALLLKGKVILQTLNSIDDYDEEDDFLLDITPVSLPANHHSIQSVEYEHNVIYTKREGDHLINTGLSQTTSTGTKRTGESFTSEELFDITNRHFSKTKEYAEGYRLVKRLSTQVTEDFMKTRLIYDTDKDTMFNYTISSNRPPAETHTDSIDEIYFISKNTDDYTPITHHLTIELVDTKGKLLKTYNRILLSSPQEKDVHSFLNMNQLKKFVSKDGSTYLFRGPIQTINSTTFQVTYDEIESYSTSSMINRPNTFHKPFNPSTSIIKPINSIMKPVNSNTIYRPIINQLTYRPLVHFNYHYFIWSFSRF
ncbi:hypothetical protein [Atopobacter phocae]|uniref:hypothetical protein n=1 Tax=Atopobacter phocae TaxID=136492 RepID=UPI0004709EA3|nr:hypothetical protein [Atopobacter phocae]